MAQPRVWLALALTLAVTLTLSGLSYFAYYWAGTCVLEGQMYRLYDYTARMQFVEQLGFYPNPVVAYVYPPPFAYITAPLALLPFHWSQRVWTWLQLIFFIIAAQWETPRP